MLAFDNCLFLDMADLLFDIIRFIINSDLNPQTDSILGLFNGNSLGVFCQCAFYFYKQVKSIFSEEEIEDKLIEIMEIYDSWVLNHKLTLSECLKALFELANLNNIVVNDNKMSVKMPWVILLISEWIGMILYDSYFLNKISKLVYLSYSL